MHLIILSYLEGLDRTYIALYKGQRDAYRVKDFRT